MQTFPAREKQVISVEKRTIEQPQALRPYISPLAAWALSLGASIGWGSFVITSNTYLSGAGPLGSVLGTVIGAAVMLLVGRNYYYMMQRCPDAGGVYSYTKTTFGYDRGFVVSWFLALTYMAMFWANATSLPLFARYFLGKQYQFGKLYTLFGYDVWLGEALLSVFAIVLIGLLCVAGKRLPMVIMAAACLIFVAAITVCFLAALFGGSGGAGRFDPAFIPDSAAFTQVMRIALISPWAFVGFENISHSVEEFTFPRQRAFRVMAASLITATLLYAFVTLLSVTAYPPEYDSWLAYIRNLSNISGIRGLPAFYAAQHYLGQRGIVLLMLALLALILTSLISNLIALSRLFYVLGRDGVLPKGIARLNRRAIPYRGVLLVVALSLAIPFLGRTAIGWIVDVTTVGATLIYGFTSAAAWKTARQERDRLQTGFGMAGVLIMTAFGVFLLLPDLFFGASMATESYFIFILWSALGIFYFRWIMARDREGRFGQTSLVWLVFLALIAFMAMVWIYKLHEDEAIRLIQAVHSYDMNKFGFSGIQVPDDPYIDWIMGRMHRVNLITTSAVIALLVLSLSAMLWNTFFLRRSGEETQRALGKVRHMVYTDPLTGVRSKRAYIEAEEEMDQSIDEGRTEPFAVVVFDVNGLKHINDTQGHEIGDRYIADACKLICRQFKHSPVFRIGGDEFVAILENWDYESRKQLLDEFDRQIEENLRSGRVVVSSGLAMYDPEEDNSFQAVFSRADERMYRRKLALKQMGAPVRE